MDSKSFYFILTLLTITLSCCYAETEPRGHMQQLGMHRDSEGHVDIVNEPPGAEEFWRKYVSQRRPLLIKNVADEFPARYLWMDDYLSYRYGRFSVKLEKKGEFEGAPAGNLGLGRDTIQHFLDTYVEENKYIVSQLPTPMYKDVLVIPSLSCGSFEHSMQEINFWMSSGGTKSMLHKDAPNIVNCLLNGTKDWFLINPKHEHMVPLAREPDLAGGGYSVLNVDHVDLKKFSKFRNAPWHYANVSAGDCLFVPYGWLHHVRSYGKKNMAVSFLFSRRLTHMKKFDNQGCDKHQYRKLTEVGVAWDFDGEGSLTMGLQDPDHYRESILKVFAGKKNLTKKAFIRLMERQILPDEPKRAAAARELLIRNFQLENKTTILVEDIYNLPIEPWKNLIYNLELDPSNTLEYEYRLFSKDDVRNVLEKSKDKSGGINVRKFVALYAGDELNGSEKTAKEIIAIFDTDKNGKISKEERKSKMSEILALFEDDMPDEHVNEYADTYVYRKQREEVPEEDEMNYEYERTSTGEVDGKGIHISKDDTEMDREEKQQRQDDDDDEDNDEDDDEKKANAHDEL